MLEADKSWDIRAILRCGELVVLFLKDNYPSILQHQVSVYGRALLTVIDHFHVAHVLSLSSCFCVLKLLACHVFLAKTYTIGAMLVSLPSTTISDAFNVRMSFDEEYRRSVYVRFSMILYDSVNVYTHKQPWDVFMSMLDGLRCIYVCIKTVRGYRVCHSARLMCQLWVESTVCIIRN